MIGLGYALAVGLSLAVVLWSLCLGGVLGGGAAPLIVAQLGQAHGTTAVGLFMAAVAISLLALPETRHRNLSAV